MYPGVVLSKFHFNRISFSLSVLVIPKYLETKQKCPTHACKQILLMGNLEDQGNKFEIETDSTIHLLNEK